MVSKKYKLSSCPGQIVFVLALLSSFQSAQGQALTNQANSTPANSLYSAQNFAAANQLAQSNPQVPTPSVIPTDVTPIGMSEEQSLFEPGTKFRIFQKLPERLWFNSTTEVSERIDTNVFFTKNRPRTDGAFRVLPNVTLGYNLFKNFSIYTNYFVIKDLFLNHARPLNLPTTQSVSLGLRQDFNVTRRTNLQLDFQARELWQASHLHQADFLPAINMTQVFTPNFIGFASVILQLRGREYFVAPTREIDPFYSIGLLYRKGSWNFSLSDTLVTNFRSPPFHGSIPRQSNDSMIADFEVARPICKQVPNLQSFIRIEPIWNWASRGVPGLSGFDYRMYGGLRLVLNKRNYNVSVDQLRQQVIDSENETAPSNSSGTSSPGSLSK